MKIRCEQNDSHPLFNLFRIVCFLNNEPKIATEKVKTQFPADVFSGKMKQSYSVAVQSECLHWGIHGPIFSIYGNNI